MCCLIIGSRRAGCGGCDEVRWQHSQGVCHLRFHRHLLSCFLLYSQWLHSIMVSSSIIALSQDHSHIFVITLKIWEWPGDEAGNITLNRVLYISDWNVKIFCACWSSYPSILSINLDLNSGAYRYYNEGSPEIKMCIILYVYMVPAFISSP